MDKDINLPPSVCNRCGAKCAVCSSNLVSGTHGVVACSFCKQEFPVELVSTHEKEQCSQRPVECEHCRLTWPAEVMQEHQRWCPEKRLICEICNESYFQQEIIYGYHICGVDQDKLRHTIE